MSYGHVRTDGHGWTDGGVNNIPITFLKSIGIITSLLIGCYASTQDKNFCDLK